MLIIKQDEGNFFFKKVNAFVYFYVNKTIRGKKTKMPKKEEVFPAVLGKPSEGDKEPHGTQ